MRYDPLQPQLLSCAPRCTPLSPSLSRFSSSLHANPLPASTPLLRAHPRLQTVRPRTSPRATDSTTTCSTSPGRPSSATPIEALPNARVIPPSSSTAYGPRTPTEVIPKIAPMLPAQPIQPPSATSIPTRACFNMNGKPTAPVPASAPTISWRRHAQPIAPLRFRPRSVIFPRKPRCRRTKSLPSSFAPIPGSPQKAWQSAAATTSSLPSKSASTNPSTQLPAAPSAPAAPTPSAFRRRAERYLRCYKRDVESANVSVPSHTGIYSEE
jgi:hypothetical protein